MTKLNKNIDVQDETTEVIDVASQLTQFRDQGVGTLDLDEQSWLVDLAYTHHIIGEDTHEQLTRKLNEGNAYLQPKSVETMIDAVLREIASQGDAENGSHHAEAGTHSDEHTEAGLRQLEMQDDEEGSCHDPDETHDANGVSSFSPGHGKALQGDQATDDAFEYEGMPHTGRPEDETVEHENDRGELVRGSRFATTTVGDVEPVDLPMPSLKEMAEMAGRLQRGESTPLELLQAALLVAAADPIIAKIRARDHVSELVAQASLGVSAITTMAHLQEVVFEGGRVTPSTDFVKWPSDRLAFLMGVLDSHVTSRVTKAATDVENARQEVLRVAPIQKMLSDARERIDELQSIATTAAAEASQRALEANTRLAAYRDVGEYIVAMIDPVTGDPQRYAIETRTADGRKLSGTNERAKATVFSTWEKANDVRVKLSRKREAPEATQGGLRRAIAAPTFVVMQTALRVVRAEDLV